MSNLWQCISLTLIVFKGSSVIFSRSYCIENNLVSCGSLIEQVSENLLLLRQNKRLWLLQTQWAAVRINLSFKMVPPQVWLELILREIWKDLRRYCYYVDCQYMCTEFPHTFRFTNFKNWKLTSLRRNIHLDNNVNINRKQNDINYW